jgi:hypothetical protein
VIESVHMLQVAKCTCLEQLESCGRNRIPTLRPINLKLSVAKILGMKEEKRKEKRERERETDEI